MNELTEPQIKLVNIFEQHYKKLDDPNSKNREFLTLQNIFSYMQNVWPSEEYTGYDVALVLQYLGVESVSGSKITYLVEFIS